MQKTNFDRNLPTGVQVFERGWLSSNNILFLGSQSSALVGSGYSTHAEQTTGLVGAALQQRPLDLLLNTHLHSDHCGGNAALQRSYPELQTLIPPGQASLVSSWDPVALNYLPSGQHCPRFKFDGLLLPGTVVQLASLNLPRSARGKASSCSRTMARCRWPRASSRSRSSVAMPMAACFRARAPARCMAMAALP